MPIFTKENYFKLLADIILPKKRKQISLLGPGAQFEAGQGEPPEGWPPEPPERPPVESSLAKAVRIALQPRGPALPSARPLPTTPVQEGFRTMPTPQIAPSQQPIYGGSSLLEAVRRGAIKPTTPPLPQESALTKFNRGVAQILAGQGPSLPSYAQKAVRLAEGKEPLPLPRVMPTTPTIPTIPPEAGSLKELGQQAVKALEDAERTGTAGGATWELLKAGMQAIAPLFEPFEVIGKVGTTNFFNLIRSLQSLAPGGARPQFYQAEGGPPMSAAEVEERLKATGVTPWLTVPVSEALTWLSLPGGVYLPYDAAQLAKLTARLATKGYRLAAKGAGKYGAELLASEAGFAKLPGKAGAKAAGVAKAPAEASLEQYLRKYPWMADEVARARTETEAAYVADKMKEARASVEELGARLAPGQREIFIKEYRKYNALTEAPTEAIKPPVRPEIPPTAERPPVEAPGAILKAEVAAPGGVPPTKPPVEGLVAPPAPAPMPPQGSASRRVLDRIQIEQPESGFINKVRQGYHQFQVKMVDDLYAIRKFTEQYTKGGVELSIEENPYMLARLLRGVSGKINTFIENGTFGKQFWKVEKGKAVPNFTGESLQNILKEVREPEAWQDFSSYLVARRSQELANRNIKTGISLEDATAAMKELESKYKNFPQLADRVYKYQDNLLVYGQEMGLLSQELLGKLRQYGNYVPFYRVFNELEAKGFMGKKMANIASPIKRIKGSEREIINPLESVVKNTHVLMNAADRNQVGIMMANLVDKNPELATMFERVKTPMAKVARVTAKELGVEVEGLSVAEAEEVIDIFRPSFFVKGDEVTVLIDGKKAYFKVDPDLRDALLNLDRESLGMIGKFLSLPAKWLRAGATLSPDFMVRNPARDAWTAMVYSNYNFLPGVDFIRGLAGLIRKDADYLLFRASGAEHSMLVSMDREYLHQTFSQIVQGKKFTDYVKHPLELFQIVSELGEKATRLGEFKAGLQSGAIPLEAGMAARNVTLDFAQAGTTAKAVNALIAFFNANVRGWTKMASSFVEHPVRTSAKVFAGITLPSILLYMANRDDPRWKEIPQWQKDLFWIVMTKDNIYRIPKPFELGIIFGSIPERFVEWLDNKDPKLMSEAFKNLAEAGSPGFLPTAALPVIENLSNYSFFRGGPIVPTSRKAMPPELQYTKWTSEVSKKLGELLNQSPAKLDNLINGWTGGLGRYATDILDGILKKTGISPDIPEPSPTLADRPVIKAFVVRNPYGSSGQAVESFYSELEKYEQGEKYLKEMMALGDKEKFEQYKAAHPELLFFMDFEKDTFYSASARYLRRVARDLTELRKKQDGIYKATDISPAEKRKLIDEIDVLKTEITRKALGLLTGEGQVLQESIKDAIKKLGTIIEETPILSLEKPDIFDTKKLYTEFGNLLEAATKEDLSKLKGIDPMALAFVGARDIKKEISVKLLNKQVSDIELDLKEGVSFEEYFKAWQSGAQKNEEFDKLTRRQLDLLASYNKLDKAGQKQFLKDHPELSANPYQDWLKSHPKENAQLAIWGQTKLLTQAAYDEAKRLIKELDIPDSALPDLTLPPEVSVKGYFQYQEQGEKFGYNSAEAKLLIAKDDKLREFLEREPIDTPVQLLELNVKYREQDKEYDALPTTGKARPNYLAANEDYRQDRRRREAYKLKPDLTKGTVVQAFADFIKLYNVPAIVFETLAVEMGEAEFAQKYGAGYAAGKISFGAIPPEDEHTVAHEVAHWAHEQLDANLKEDFQQQLISFSLSKKPNAADSLLSGIIRRVAKGAPITKEISWEIYAELYADSGGYIQNIPASFQHFFDLLTNPKARRLTDEELKEQTKRKLEAFGETKDTLEDFVENYVAYYELPVAGYRQERFLIKNPGFAEAVGLKVPAKVPSEQYDVLLEKPARTAQDLLRMKAYKLYIPDRYIEDYVAYSSLKTVREQDIWMMAHPDYYRDVWLGILGNQRKDYRQYLLPSPQATPAPSFRTIPPLKPRIPLVPQKR